MRGNPDIWSPEAIPPRSGAYYSWSHPPLGRIFIGLGIASFGDRPFGWRIASAVAGSLVAVVLFDLALGITGSLATAALAATLLLLSGLWFVQSRMALLDPFLTLFTTAIVSALYKWWTVPPERRRMWLVVLATCSGLAISVKWSGVFPVAAAAATVIAVTLFEPPRSLKIAVGRALVLVLLPATIYVAAYTPYFAAGHGPADFVAFQRRVAGFHVMLRRTHPDQSPWWSWPLLRRPVWYYAGDETNIYAQGNPALFWAFVPAVVWALYRWWTERRNAALAVLAIGFLGQWLPWAISPRMTFLYHFLPAVPFGCLAVAVAVQAMWMRSRRGRLAAVVYVAAVALTFAFFYPVYAGVPLTPPMLERRIWFDRWR